MARSVTTRTRANHKPARMPTALLDGLLDGLCDDALSPADLKRRLRGRSLRAVKRGPFEPQRRPSAPSMGEC